MKQIKFRDVPAIALLFLAQSIESIAIRIGGVFTADLYLIGMATKIKTYKDELKDLENN